MANGIEQNAWIGETRARLPGVPVARFGLGQLVHHKLFGYRGVIVGVDPSYQGTDEWYERMAKTRPPKDRPWYNLLVHGAAHQTYVSERNLELDGTTEPINHPHVWLFFDSFENGWYLSRRMVH
jgi:heat shock protein HspQ